MSEQTEPTTNEQILHPKKIKICSTHAKDNWQKHTQYIDNLDGTISCKLCPFGAKVPGYMKVVEGQIVDLRASKSI